MKKIFYIVCFFPFIDWFGIGGGSDIQPYCIVLTALLLVQMGMKNKIVLGKKVIDFYKILLLAIGVSMMVTLITSGGNLGGSIRYLATYGGLVIISCYTYLISKRYLGVDEQLVKIVIHIYMIVGVIQVFYNKFGYSVIANARTSSNRGVISLTSEPSFYGYMCVFFMILAFTFKKGKVYYIINLLIQIVFLAKSSISILYVLIFVGLYFLCSINKISKEKLYIAPIIIVGVIGTLVFLFNSDSFRGQRIFFFINTLLSRDSFSDILQLLMNDYSTFVRFNDIAECIIGFFENIGFPYGFSTRKISSGYGSLILTMGWLGVIVIVMIYRFCKGAFKGELQKIVPVFITIIMFSAIQLANPVFAFLVGYFMYMYEQNLVKELGGR